MDVKSLCSLIAYTCVVSMISIYGTLCLTRPFSCVDHNPLQVQDGQHEYIDRVDDPTTNFTIIRAAVAGKCFIVRRQQQVTPNSEAKTTTILRISPNSYARTVAVELFGVTSVERCMGLPIHEVAIDSVSAHRRHRRQSTRNVSSVEGSNECQDRTLIDCGANNVGTYQCVTGPNSIYAANTACKSATQFVVNVQPRCDQFDATRGLRFIKCLQYFLLNKHLQQQQQPN